MKKLYSLMVLLIIAANIVGQVPESFKYQAVLRDASGNIKVNSDVVIDFSVLQGSATGTQVFIETHSVKTNEFGLVNLGIGSKNTAGFSAIDWSNGPYYVKIIVDGVQMGITQLLSVPYALYAKSTENEFSGDYSDLANKPDFASWDQNSADDFSGSYNDLTNKPAIPSINDATTSSSALWSSTKVSNELSDKANGSDIYTKTNLQTSGQAIVNYNNINNKPANLDENSGNDVTLSETQVISGAKTFSNTIIATNGINASNKSIINVASPINSTDAVNKLYVDELSIKLDQLYDYIESIGLPVTDVDGNYYNIGKIGDQVWMTEDLRTTKYNDGTSIPYVTLNSDWLALNTPAYCWYENNVIYRYPYGALYNWYAVNTGKLCPSGWHVASDSDWKELEMSLGMTQAEVDNNGWRGSDQGTQIKNITGWNFDGNGTNSSGFSAIPGGLRDWDDGIFYWLGLYTHWWTSTEETSSTAWDRDVYYGSAQIFRYPNSKIYGFSVRCVMD